jgi:hypothetical protein
MGAAVILVLISLAVAAELVRRNRHAYRLELAESLVQGSALTSEDLAARSAGAISEEVAEGLLEHLLEAGRIRRRYREFRHRGEFWVYEAESPARWFGA